MLLLYYYCTTTVLKSLSPSPTPAPLSRANLPLQPPPPTRSSAEGPHTPSRPQTSRIHQNPSKLVHSTQTPTQVTGIMGNTLFRRAPNGRATGWGGGGEPYTKDNHKRDLMKPCLPVCNCARRKTVMHYYYLLKRLTSYLNSYTT